MKTEETKKKVGAMPTPSIYNRACNASGNKTHKDTHKIAYPQGAEAVEGLKRLTMNCSEAPMRGCLLTMKTGEEWATEAEEEADDMPLYRSMWYEGQLALLFSDTGQGQTILATQIAVDLARQGRRVLYCDFEMSRKQFLKRISRTVDGEERERYLSMASRGEALPEMIAISDDADADATVRELYDLPETLFRAEPNELWYDDRVYKLDVFQSIEQWAEEFNADIVVVDNLTFMSGGEPWENIQKLKCLQRRKGWSMLVLAHTHKHASGKPLTATSVWGSASILRAVDTAFALGCSVDDMRMKYIKQIKSQDEYEYGADNVITCRIEREGGLFLKLKETGYAREADLLRKSKK